MKIIPSKAPVKLPNLKLIASSSKSCIPQRIAILMLLLILLCPELKAQDPQFSQFFANPLYLNPAFVGSSKCPRFTMNYRNEWPSLSGTFVTSSAAFDQHANAINGGLGVLILSDRAGGGTLNTISGNLLYSYFTGLNRKWSLRVGFQAGYIQKKIDWEKLTFGDMIDPRYGFIYETAETNVNNTKGNLDISTGALLYSSKYYGGFAVHHLTRPAEGFINHDQARLPMKFTFHAGALIVVDGFGEDFNISPNFVYQQQQDFKQTTLGGYLKRGPLLGGLWYRHAEKNSDSFILLTGIQMGVIKMGYSYDITLSRLSNASGGSHELSVVVQFACRPKSPTRKPVDCHEWSLSPATIPIAPLSQ